MNDDQNQKTEDQAPVLPSQPIPDTEIEAPKEDQLPPPTDMQIEAPEDEGQSVGEPSEPEQITQETASVEQPQSEENTVQEAVEKEAEDREEAQESQANEPTDQVAPEEKSQPTTSKASDAGKWYIIHTYSGHENKVAKSLHQRVESMRFENRIFDIIVPTRDTIKVSQGKKENVKEKIFPGYVLVKMILDDESWLLVRTTQGVTAFIGAGNKPTPISDKEVAAIKKFMEAEEPLFTTTFTVGEAVKIVDGPFTDFLGTVDNIDDARGKIKVLVSIFGRETPVELDFLQVTKL